MTLNQDRENKASALRRLLESPEIEEWIGEALAKGNLRLAGTRLIDEIETEDDSE